MRNYTTSQVARETGIHPNTVRLYEELGLIPKPERQANGYRVFTQFHIEQIRLTRIALRVEVLQNGLRKQAIEIVKVSARRNLDEASRLTGEYLSSLKKERGNALEAIALAKAILADVQPPVNLSMKRKEAARHLQITTDTLRNWELNGLLTVKRMRNGYRVYTEEDIRRLKIIRSLRCAHYSLDAILRMLNALSRNAEANIERSLDTPDRETDVISACDRLITSLLEAENQAELLLLQLEKMRNLS